MMRELLEGSVTRLLRVGAYAALLGLAIMCSSLIWPRALPVIFAMSVGHVVGAVAVLCYLLAVRLDARRVHLRKRESGEKGSLPAVDAPPPSSPER